jgi:hypothetical protein
MWTNCVLLLLSTVEMHGRCRAAVGPTGVRAGVAARFKIVKIGDLADFLATRPRCTKYLRQSKSAYADFFADSSPHELL